MTSLRGLQLFGLKTPRKVSSEKDKGLKYKD